MTDIAPKPPGKRLAVFFDGTWNEPPDHTNVRRLRLMMAEADSTGIPQRAFYDPGVGTRWYDSLSGGMFGAGLSDNVRSGYRWLVENYDRGDEIYIFGFSRGAFTARSLAGIIARCGLLEPDSPMSFTQVFERYQRGMDARPIYELLRLKQDPGLDYEERVLLRSSYYTRNLIKMVGVWDTVGSIGVPFGNIKGISRRTLQFHNTRLSRTIQHSYHAMALDEFRSPYWVVLWTEFFSDAVVQATSGDKRVVEQRWFSGAHANVGGGYRDDPLPDRPLAWMQQKAVGCGLSFRSTARIRDDDLRCSPTDSYSEFLKGAWKVATFGRRFTRSVIADPVSKETHPTDGGAPVKGTVVSANERIDPSVLLRCQQIETYRPIALVEWAKRRKLDLEAIIKDPEQYAYLSAAVTASGVERPTGPAPSG